MEYLMQLHGDLLLNACVSAISAGANFYYVTKHANGKKGIRMVSCFIMIYFTIIQVLAAFHLLSDVDFGAVYFRPWMPVLYLIPVFDLIVDFRHKNIAPKGG